MVKDLHEFTAPYGLGNYAYYGIIIADSKLCPWHKNHILIIGSNKHDNFVK